MPQQIHDHGSVRPVRKTASRSGCRLASNERGLRSQRKRGYESYTDTPEKDISGVITLIRKDFPVQGSELAELRKSTKSREQLISELKSEVDKIKK